MFRLTRALILLLLLVGGIHPNPGPPSSLSPLPVILQFNCNGIKNSVSELDSFLRDKRISVAALQETFLSDSSPPPSFPGYTLVRKDRARGRGGGLAFLVHQTVSYTPVDSSFLQDGFTECHAIKATLNNSDLIICNIYLPPASSCPSTYKPDLSSLFSHSDDDTLIVGDFNAHNEGWDSTATDPRGERIADQIELSPLIILNSDTPTRLPKSGAASSPDVTLASAHIALASTWATHVNLNSDHLPITISLPSDEAPPRRSAKCYTNFCKANWSMFIRESEAAFRKLGRPTSCGAGVKAFCHVILEAAKHSIPAGYRRDYTPGISNEAADLIKERDNIRAADPEDEAIGELNTSINRIINENKRAIWRDRVKASGSRPDTTKLWSLLRGLSGKRTHIPPNQPISFDSVIHSNPDKIAECFIKQYVPRPKSDPLTRRVRRRLLKEHPLDHGYSPFTAAATDEALRLSSNSTATGPDGLCSLHLKHLGQSGIVFLTDLFNLSVRGGVIPAIWKKALVLPVLKPGKPADQGTSYRPISLISPVVKILERLLLPSLTSAFVLSPTQHGFRPFRSTTTALLPIISKVSEGFNQSKPAARTVVVAIDLSKAFDTVDLTLLIQQIAKSSLHHNLVRWLSTYLRGRSAACIFNGSQSKFRIVHVGVPQGSVLSPCLFNLFTSDFPEVNDVKTLFADDITIGKSDPDLSVIEKALNEDLERVSKWAKRKRLKISAEKSQVILFTPNNREVDIKPRILYEGNLIPVKNKVKILGLDLETMHTGATQEASAKSKGSGRLRIIKAVMGADWGLTKEDGLLTYKALISPVFSNVAPVWVPLRSSLKHPVASLQKLQNAALRTITGSHAAASEQHLHDECKMLPVHEHLNLQCRQFLANTRQVGHPSHEVTSRPPGPRPNMKATLQHCYGNDIDHLLTTHGTISDYDYKKAIKTLHTEAVSATLASAPLNRVLGARPPEISPTETSLPRVARTTLSQLRSDFSKRLNSYKKFIQKAADDTCPSCQSSSQTVSHVFSCPATPTRLVPYDLWARPREAVTFLSSLPSFSYLPPLDPPPPRPPPEPPPPGGACRPAVTRRQGPVLRDVV